jgi:hypothetical protein
VVAGRSGRTTSRAPPRAKPATTRTGPPAARLATAASAALAARSTSPRMMAGKMSIPFGKTISWTSSPNFPQCSFMKETAP